MVAALVVVADLVDVAGVQAAVESLVRLKYIEMDWMLRTLSTIGGPCVKVLPSERRTNISKYLRRLPRVLPISIRTIAPVVPKPKTRAGWNVTRDHALKYTIDVECSSSWGPIGSVLMIGENTICGADTGVSCP